jgi:hypothetical protein
MIRRLLLGPYKLAEPWVRHPSWVVRRPAQVAVLGIATIWLALPRGEKAERDAPEPVDELARQFWSSPRLLEFLNGPAIGKPVIGRICRLLVLRLSVAAKLRERASADDRNFVLRFNGPIDQKSLRNLLIWQNHVLPSYVEREDAQVDVALVLANRSANEARLFDLISILLMLERFRSFAVFWDEDTALAATSVVMSQREVSRWRAGEPASDLSTLPRQILRQVELRGTRGGIKLLPHGRKYANDFLKLALPGRFIVAVALREGEDGTIVPDELEFWLCLIERLGARYPRAAFVMLNRLAPSQWREWPVHLRFARHHGLNLQDAMCLAQIADGYLGVLDLFGLAAHSAGRPGVYVPLDDLPPSDRGTGNSGASQILVGSGNRADIEAAVKNLELAPIHAPFGCAGGRG